MANQYLLDHRLVPVVPAVHRVEIVALPVWNRRWFDSSALANLRARRLGDPGNLAHVHLHGRDRYERPFETLSLGKIAIQPEQKKYAWIDLKMIRSKISELKIKMTRNRNLRWNLIARGAGEQCGENWLPIIEDPIKLDRWAANVESKIKILLYPNSDNKISDFKYKDSVSLAIGPEGDFSDYEVDSLTEKGFIPVSIGKRILRAETAAISAISSVRFSAKEF